MAEVSRGRGIFGRLLAAIGLVWVFWGFFGSVIGLQFGRDLVALPILPGLVIFFLGRALARRASRGELSSRGEATAEDQSPPPDPRVRPSPVPEPIRLEAEAVPEPDRVSDVIVGAFEPPEPELSVPDYPATRKSSAEMVAEARQRYGKRP